MKRLWATVLAALLVCGDPVAAGMEVRRSLPRPCSPLSAAGLVLSVSLRSVGAMNTLRQPGPLPRLNGQLNVPAKADAALATRLESNRDLIALALETAHASYERQALEQQPLDPALLERWAAGKEGLLRALTALERAKEGFNAKELRDSPARQKEFGDRFWEHMATLTGGELHLALMPSLQDALAQASRCGLSVFLMKDGEGRVLAFLGEAHANSRRSFAAGKNILQHFPDRGVEGKEFNAFEKVFFPIVMFLPRLLAALLGWTRGSLADEAVREAKKDPSLRVSYLEEGHQPDLGERMALPLLAFLALGEVLFPLLLTLSDHPSTPAALAVAAVSAFVLYVAVGLYSVVSLLLHPFRFASAPWFQCLFWFSPFVSLERGRNRTIASNILKIFQREPLLALFLVIAGRAHMAGLRRLMSARGFSPIRFQDLPASHQ